MGTMAGDGSRGSLSLSLTNLEYFGEDETRSNCSIVEAGCWDDSWGMASLILATKDDVVPYACLKRMGSTASNKRLA